jgi:hypothetical protein
VTVAFLLIWQGELQQWIGNVSYGHICTAVRGALGVKHMTPMTELPSLVLKAAF